MDKKRSRWQTIGSELFLPFAILIMISNFIVGSDRLLAIWDRYRPALVEATVTTHVQKQMLHIEAESRLNESSSKVIFIGSSSVVNGLDPEVVNTVWDDKGYSGQALNYGQTGLMAYELPFLKEYLFPPRTEAVVFLYNAFSFSDIMHPQAASIRFDTLEFFHASAWKRASINQLAKGVLGELLFVARYRGVIKNILIRFAAGQLEPLAYPWDVPPTGPRPGYRTRRVASPVRHWLRRAYETSDNEGSTLGYRSLRRFMEIARAEGVILVVAPAPVPDFAATNQYRVGIDQDRIDKRVAEIAADHDVPFMSRSEIRHFERNDTLFRDRVHLHHIGRTIYSEWLAKRLLTFLDPAK